jgi:hypothetical protein
MRSCTCSAPRSSLSSGVQWPKARRATGRNISVPSCVCLDHGNARAPSERPGGCREARWRRRCGRVRDGRANETERSSPPPLLERPAREPSRARAAGSFPAHPRRRFRAAAAMRDSSPEGFVAIWRPKRYEVGASCPLTPNSVRPRSHVRFPAESHELTRS